MDDDKTRREDLDSTETARPQASALPEQTEPVRRKVALKTIKHGMETPVDTCLVCQSQPQRMTD